MNLRFIACFLMTLFAAGTALVVQHSTPVRSAESRSEERVKVSLCDLKKDPAAYNHKLLEITGFVSHGFEDFTFFDTACSSWPQVWLEYGGTAASGTMYCCGVTSARSRPAPLVIDNIRVELVSDQRFSQFDKLIQRGPDSMVRATLFGRFFSGELTTRGNSESFWGGYGHMGCCSLFVIQQVVSVDPQNSTELDYRASADQPDNDKVGCGYTFLTEIDLFDESIKAQARADGGQEDWAFSDPTRVAAEGLARLINADPRSITLRQKQKAQGRFIYEWRPRRNQKVTYMVVVSHPYWLSFHAKDPKRVAWIVAAAYESSCSGRNSVERIK